MPGPAACSRTGGDQNQMPGAEDGRELGKPLDDGQQDDLGGLQGACSRQTNKPRYPPPKTRSIRGFSRIISFFIRGNLRNLRIEKDVWVGASPQPTGFCREFFFPQMNANEHKSVGIGLLSSTVRSLKSRCPALFGAARDGVVLRYAAFGAVPPRDVSQRG